MGSSISILNDTKDIWYVKIGPDEAAASITAYVAGGVTLVAAAVATAGGAAPLLAAAANNGIISIRGVSTANLAAVASAAAQVAGAAGAASTVGGIIKGVVQASLDNRADLHKLMPGEEYKEGGKSLSLWQQGTCISYGADPSNPDKVVIRTLYMRPIFSGATAGGNLQHSIAWWIGKWGTDDMHVEMPVAGKS